MKPFDQLSPLGRGRRMRPLAHLILKQYGITQASLSQITAASNTIYRVTTPDGRRFVLRIVAPKSCHAPEETRSEIQWLRAIATETDIGVPAPVPALNGRFSTTVTHPLVPGERHAVLFHWIPGRMLDDCRTTANAHRHGALLAGLHQHAKGFRPDRSFRIRTYKDVFPYANPTFANVEPVALDDPRYASLFPPARKHQFGQARMRIQTIIDRLFESSQPPRVIHNDLHVWNVHVTREKLYALDFEDLLWGFPIQDIATTLYYYRYLDAYPELLEAFRAGYETVTVWPASSDADLEALIVGRGILLSNYVAVSEDPEDRLFAPTYLERMEGRIRRFLETT